MHRVADGASHDRGNDFRRGLLDPQAHERFGRCTERGDLVLRLVGVNDLDRLLRPQCSMRAHPFPPLSALLCHTKLLTRGGHRPPLPSGVVAPAQAASPVETGQVQLLRTLNVVVAPYLALPRGGGVPRPWERHQPPACSPIAAPPRPGALVLQGYGSRDGVKAL